MEMKMVKRRRMKPVHLQNVKREDEEEEEEEEEGEKEDEAGSEMGEGEVVSCLMQEKFRRKRTVTAEEEEEEEEGRSLGRRANRKLRRGRAGRCEPGLSPGSPRSCEQCSENSSASWRVTAIS